ncbi:FxsA family protein [Marinicellulosiphila megalodicopiae]|uniref:FxsA family protein n=1 Tax=Marinicellulosiphila megalodicopiae TaxID=2724896 RepID=UPI003BB1949A
MFRFFIFALIALVVIELYTLVAVAEVVGVLGTIGLAIGTAIVGLNILAGQTKRQMFKLQQAIQAGRNPQEVVAEGIWMLICGLMLLVPGLLTDVVGVMLLIPFIRQWLVAKGYAPKFNMPFSGFRPQNEPEEDVVEGEFYEEVPRKSHLNDDSK